MKIATKKLKKLCRERHLTITQLLSRAGVSRNAYYTVARKPSVLPTSILAIASELNVNPSAFLEQENVEQQKARMLLAKVNKITRYHAEADPDNIRHTLLLLQEEPITRLERALVRAQKPDLHR